MSEFLITVPTLLLWIAIASRFIQRFPRDDQPLLWLAFVAHQAAGVTAILVTGLYYGGDMVGYYRYALAASAYLRQDFFELAPAFVRVFFQERDALPIPLPTMPGSTGSMDALSAFLAFFLFDSLYAMCAMIAGAAFLAKVGIYRVVSEELPEIPRSRLIAASMLVPSAVFWSNGLLKEPIVMLGLCAAVFAWHRIMAKRISVVNLLLLVFGCGLMLVIKAYVFLTFGACAACWYALRGVKARRGAISLNVGQILIGLALVTAVIFGTGAIFPKLAIDNLDDQAARYQTIGERGSGRSSYSLGAGSGDTGSQAAVAPLALATSLFRPVIFEADNAFMLVSGLEMALITSLFLWGLRRRGFMGVLREILRRPFLAFCAAFVVIFGTGVGITTTNLGTLARYRMPMMPFFVVLLTVLVTRRPRTLTAKAVRQSLVPSH